MSDYTPPTISKFIVELEKIKSEHGDLPVILEDYYGWHGPDDLVHSRPLKKGGPDVKVLNLRPHEWRERK